MIRVYKIAIAGLVSCIPVFTPTVCAAANTAVFLLNEYQEFASTQNIEALKANSLSSLQTTSCVEEGEQCVAAAINGASNGSIAITVQDPTSTLAFLAQSKSNRRIHSIVLFGLDFYGDLSPEVYEGLPNTLVVSTSQDFSSNIIRSKRLVSQLRENNLPISFAMISIEKGNSLGYLEEDSALIKTVALFSGAEVTDQSFVNEFEAFMDWQDPPLNSTAFWKFPDLIESYPLDEKSRLASILEFFYKKKPHLQKQWSMDQYHAFDVLGYRKHLGLSNEYRFLTLSNFRGHKIRVDLNDYAEYEPVIVVGVGHEKELFRWTWFYKTKAKYTWKDEGEPELSARTLGPFLYFRKRLPKELLIPLLMRSALKFEGIQFVKDDPLKDLYELPKNIHQVLLKEGRCIDCHAVGDLGGHGYHISAKTGEGQDGFALPLTAYSPEVLEAFLFDQENVAAQLGMSPLKVRPDAAKEMYEWFSQKSE